MSDTRLFGRVGGLAVALGVGVRPGVTRRVLVAEPCDSDSSSDLARSFTSLAATSAANSSATAESCHRTTEVRASTRSGDRRELLLTAGLLVFTFIATALLVGDIVAITTTTGASIGELSRLLLFTGAVCVLIYGNIAFQSCRLGYLVRRLRHDLPPFETVVEKYWERAEPIAILVPSYKEDARTIRQTLLTAALQHHPDARVVLLLDDPPDPGDAASAQLLQEARQIPGEIEAMFGQPRAIIADARSLGDGCGHANAELERVLGVYAELIGWFDQMAAQTPVNDHTDAHFITVAFSAHHELLKARAGQLGTWRGRAELLGQEMITREYRRLERVFSPQISVFERKRYCNLYHEPNKAANLNAYIELLGKHVREDRTPDGIVLRQTEEPDARKIRDATYVLSLDADSMVVPDYALRLASLFEAQGNERVAVVQTPYSTVPDPPGVLERIAGATTDVQYVIHQGFTFWRATFWVGANALLKKRALDDIRTESVEDGIVVARYIQDRTLIEDTESTIDLARAGWSLLNYPERLAYSATPPDFGSLLIQRSRWANGGLIILPKAIRQLIADHFRPSAITTFFIRLHYLSSIATGSLGILILLFLPLDVEMKSLWLPLTAVPYYLLYWRELVRLGYHRTDILRVYAFNLMLIPINMAGVLKSVHQGLTGKRMPFRRTPKVAGRTAAPRWAIVSLWALIAWCAVGFGFDAAAGRWMHALFALGTGIALTYATCVFVGLRSSWHDSGLTRLTTRRLTSTA